VAHSIEIDIVAGPPAWHGHEDFLSRALIAAAQAEGASGSVSLLLGDDVAIAELNAQFRDKQGPTNVLSFPPAWAGEGGEGFLGDIALAAETIAAEAESQGKRFENHAAHLVVHGFLHLLGYDHMEPDQAEAMEARERAIVATLGITDPYA